MSRPGLWVVGVLVRLYPAEFRRRFGEGISYALQQEHRRARVQGPGAVMTFWLSTVWHALAEAARERMSGGRVGRGAPELSINRRRERVGGEMMTQTIREVGLALRRMVKRPGFAIVGIVTLGLGIGATTAIFSVLNTVILRPLSYESPDRLVQVGHRSDQSNLGVPTGGYFEYTARSSTLSDLAVYVESTTTFPVNDEPRELGLIRATPNLFDVLGVSAARGRTFVADDIVDGADPVAVISHSFWQRMYGGDLEIVGRPLEEGETTLIIGVMPEDFDFIRPPASVVFGNAFGGPDIFFPMRLRESTARFGNFIYQGIGRLSSDATVAEARTELHRLMRDAADRYSAMGLGHSRASLDEGQYVPVVETLKDAVVGDIGRVLWILMGTVSLVLLIAAANVTNLFVLRAESMQKELAVRTALGASRRSVARWFLAEGLTLSTLGGVLGLVVASFGTRAVLRLAPGDLPRIDQLGVDPAVLGFALGLALLSGVIFGLVPVVRHRRLASVGLVMGGHRTSTDGASRRRAREALVVGQVAFALILLVGSGLLLRTFVSLRGIDPGFGDSNVMTFKLALNGGQFDGELSRAQFMVTVADRVAQLPGVTRAAFSADLPVDGNEWSDAIVTSDDFVQARLPSDNTLRVFAGAGYLDVIGAELLSGRDFEALDFADYPRVAVVNEAFAAERWPGEDPLGRRIAQWQDDMGPEDDVWYSVVGVVGDIRERSLVEVPEPTVYLPTVFLPESDYAMFVTNQTLLVRTAGSPTDMIQSVREQVRAIDPQILVDRVATLDQLTASSMQQVTFAMVLVIISAFVALALGVVGIYGAMSYTVGQRTREFGVRIALGATASDVRRSVLHQGGKIGLAGITIGLIGAVLTTRALQTLLFGVSAVDLPTYFAVALGLFGLVLFAGLIPAQSATRVDPVSAMTAE